jgi:MFS family permease
VQANAAPSRRRWLVLAIVLCASVMNQLDTTVVNLAAPSVRADIGGGLATVQWLAAGYTLAFAVFLIASACSPWPRPSTTTATPSLPGRRTGPWSSRPLRVGCPAAMS